MREIPLTKGFVAIVDDEDFDWLNQWKWHATGKGGAVYAARRDGKNGPVLFMHRVIADPPSGLLADHRNRNTLDNRRVNLRAATPGQNVFNRILPHGEVPYRGVGRCSAQKSIKYYAAIYVARQRHYLGRFSCPLAAARAYDRAAREHHGEFAVLNFPDQHPDLLGVAA